MIDFETPKKTMMARNRLQIVPLNLLTTNVPSYRDQSVDLQSKSTDRFVYEWNIGR